MSGIFGIIRLPGAAVSDTELAPMAETLKHRGPDGTRYFARENAGLGHSMLQSTPESLHEVLPFRDQAAGLTITADARIDNRDQLFRDLSVVVATGEVITDSQLIFRAYLKWGEACVDHLLGDFVFGIWDERAQALFVARDHMGCKPFYYHCSNGLFVFASSAMAVARVAEVKATLNEGRAADYLVQELEGINKTCSWYNEISRMPPAQCGYFRNNAFNFRQYWTLEPADLSHLQTDEDYLEAFTEVYSEAVRCRLRCQTEPASMLSGGLDSSTVVALARDILMGSGNPPLRTYSGLSEDWERCPETQSVKAVVSAGGLNSTCLQPSDVYFFMGRLSQIMQVLEDAFDSDWTLLSTLFANGEQDGVKVMLSGLDGEHAVGAPTNYLCYLLFEGKWLTAWNESRKFSAHYYRGSRSPNRLFFSALRSRVTPNIYRRVRARCSVVLFARTCISKKLVSKEMVERVGLQFRKLEYDTSNAFPLVGEGLQRWHIQAMQVPFLTAAIERYERLAGYAGIEVRHPLLDIRLLRLSAAMPLCQKVQSGWSKLILRRVATRCLPAAVAWREGWEALGWKYTVRQARQMDPCGSESGLDNKAVLAQEDGWPGNAGSFDIGGLMNEFHRNQLIRWVKQNDLGPIL